MPLTCWSPPFPCPACPLPALPVQTGCLACRSCRGLLGCFFLPLMDGLVVPLALWSLVGEAGSVPSPPGCKATFSGAATVSPGGKGSLAGESLGEGKGWIKACRQTQTSCGVPVHMCAHRLGQVGSHWHQFPGIGLSRWQRLARLGLAQQPLDPAVCRVLATIFLGADEVLSL